VGRGAVEPRWGQVLASQARLVASLRPGAGLRSLPEAAALSIPLLVRQPGALPSAVGSATRLTSGRCS
jgi:hypothetical protein